MPPEEQIQGHRLEDKLVTHHAFVIALCYEILVHVAAALFAVLWLANAGVMWAALASWIVIAIGIYLIGPFETDREHPPLADPPFHPARP